MVVVLGQWSSWDHGSWEGRLEAQAKVDGERSYLGTTHSVRYWAEGGVYAHGGGMGSVGTDAEAESKGQSKKGLVYNAVLSGL